MSTRWSYGPEGLREVTVRSRWNAAWLWPRWRELQPFLLRSAGVVGLAGMIVAVISSNGWRSGDVARRLPDPVMLTAGEQAADRAAPPPVPIVQADPQPDTALELRYGTQPADSDPIRTASVNPAAPPAPMTPVPPDLPSFEVAAASSLGGEPAVASTESVPNAADERALADLASDAEIETKVAQASPEEVEAPIEVAAVENGPDPVVIDAPEDEPPAIVVAVSGSPTDTAAAGGTGVQQAVLASTGGGTPAEASSAPVVVASLEPATTTTAERSGAAPENAVEAPVSDAAANAPTEASSVFTKDADACLRDWLVEEGSSEGTAGGCLATADLIVAAAEEDQVSALADAADRRAQELAALMPFVPRPRPEPPADLKVEAQPDPPKPVRINNRRSDWPAEPPPNCGGGHAKWRFVDHHAGTKEWYCK